MSPYIIFKSIHFIIFKFTNILFTKLLQNFNKINMQKFYYLILSMLFIGNTFQSVNAQNFQFAKRLGGFNIDHGNSITSDATGNIYITGVFQGTADFDPGANNYNLISAGAFDMFVVKLDASGNFIWAKQFGGTDNDYGNDIAIDALGNILVTGQFKGTADFDPGVDTFNLIAPVYNMYVLKLDSLGNFLWVKQMVGSSGVDHPESITTDALGNIYTTGNFQSIVDFDPSSNIFELDAGSNYDIFISKLNSDGNFVWAKPFEGNWTNYSKSIITDASGNIYTTGNFRFTVDFDPGPNSYNLTSTFTNMFVSKLDSSGNFIWAKMPAAGNSSAQGEAITIDLNGDLCLTGTFAGTVDFDLGIDTFNLTTTLGWDIFVLKIDSSANFIWTKQFKRNSTGTQNIGHCIQTDASGNVYTVGSFDSTVDFDPGPDSLFLTTNGYGDIFVSKLDEMGNFMWAKSWGGAAADQGYSLTLDALGNVYSIGDFQGTADFDPEMSVFNLTGINTDVFLHKLGPTVSSYAEPSLPKALNSFPNPTNGKLYLQIDQSNTNTNIIVRNMLGEETIKKVYQHGNQIELTIEGEAGVYFIEIINGDTRNVLKVVKE